MYTGKILFAQLMHFLPWTTFARIVTRYGGDHRVRTLPCTEHFRILAFAQLTYRESLRDIEACLSAQAAKLYHMGIRSPVRRATMADANEHRDWRIYAEFAQRLTRQARRLYATEELGLDLSNTVYALDATTIDLCLALFPWAPFRSTKAAVKLHTLLDLRGAIPSFIHISDGKLHDVNALDLLIPEPAAIYVMDRGYLDFDRLFTLHQAGAFFVTRAKANTDFRRIYSAPSDRAQGIICDQTIALSGFYTHQRYPIPLRRTLQGSRDRQDAHFLDQPVCSAGRNDLRLVQSTLAGRVVFQMDQATSAHQEVLWHFRECRQGADLDRGIGIRARGHCQKAAQPGCLALHIATDFFRHPVRENPFKQGLFRYQVQLQE